METILSLSFLLVAPFWLLMILVPHWHWTSRIMRSPLVVAPAAALYLVLVLPQFVTVFLVVLNPTLPTVAALLGAETGATIAWVHFLAFSTCLWGAGPTSTAWSGASAPGSWRQYFSSP